MSANELKKRASRKLKNVQAISLPEQGQIVKLRHKIWAVNNVIRLNVPSDGFVHRVALECLSDDALGREIDVIWEREIAPIALESTALPSPQGIDPPDLLRAFLTALRWSSASLAEGDVLQAPFRGGIQIEEYQLAPVIRAVKMPRVRLLIADDVGLGKTIEAGLIAQELIHSHRASRILVICPAHLKTKWMDEMAEKFGLEFRIIERETVLQMRREFGPTINPWASFPRLVTSIDYLKTEHPRRLFEELAYRRSEESKGSKPWDLLILDEAHNTAPAGQKNYVRDSDRTSLMRAISELFEHKLFLTATPHNGYRESFTGLLELLDSLRFSRGTDLDKKQLSMITIRRLKDEIRNPDGTRRFPKRIILPRKPELDPMLYVELSKEEHELFQHLNEYTESRLTKVDKRSERPMQFVLTLLKKRALSSPLALRETLIVHTETVGVREELDIGDSLFRALEQKEQEDWSDDEDKEENLTAATVSASRLCKTTSNEEKQWLHRMFQITEQYANPHSVKPDSKAIALIRWIIENLQKDGRWNDERVIVFTEYVHTVRYLERILEEEGMKDAVQSIVGGMPSKDREDIHQAFQSSPKLNPVRILLATDAASEGADFQRYCRNIIHYEIPWNPVRLEQRNGRIDRHGQRAPEVFVHHFVYRNHEDSEFLKRIVEKVETIRADLGSVGAVIAENVRRHSLGHKVSLETMEMDTRRAAASRELELESQESDSIVFMVKTLNKARKHLGITDDTQLEVLRRALELEECREALAIKEDGTFTISQLPTTWSECMRYVSKDHHKHVLTFDRCKARDNDDFIIVHLEHPLLRRAMATFRVQMWGAGDSNRRLWRCSIEQIANLSYPVLLGWGRLVLLGPEHNRLHEGLVNVAAKVENGRLIPLSVEEQKEILKRQRSSFSASLNKVARIVDEHLESLTVLLRKYGDENAKELQAVLMTRGKEAAKYARSLAIERINAIRKTIRKWEEETSSQQLRLFDLEERKQLEQDIASLRGRLEILQEEREKEPKRQQALFRVKQSRIYPVALQIFVPEETH